MLRLYLYFCIKTFNKHHEKYIGYLSSKQCTMLDVWFKGSEKVQSMIYGYQ